MVFDLRLLANSLRGMGVRNSVRGYQGRYFIKVAKSEEICAIELRDLLVASGFESGFANPSHRYYEVKKEERTYKISGSAGDIRIAM